MVNSRARGGGISNCRWQGILIVAGQFAHRNVELASRDETELTAIASFVLIVPRPPMVDRGDDERIALRPCRRRGTKLRQSLSRDDRHDQ